MPKLRVCAVPPNETYTCAQPGCAKNRAVRFAPRQAQEAHRVMLQIVAEVILAIGTFVVARQFWICFKRNSYLARVIRDESHLEGFITRDALDHPSAMMAMFAGSIDEMSYVNNIHIANVADRKSTYRMKVILAIVLMIIGTASYFLGVSYLIINTVVLFLAGLAPVSQPAQASALHHVSILALILYRWNLKDPAECEKWIGQAWTLRSLYNVVKKIH